MSTRYILNTLALISGASLAVASQAFATGPLEWIAFGVSAGVLLLGVIGIALGQRARHTLGFGALSAVAAWSVVASLVFSGSTALWLIFADALGIAAVALTSLVVHEFTTERVVHTLEVREQAEAHAVSMDAIRVSA